MSLCSGLRYFFPFLPAYVIDTYWSFVPTEVDPGLLA